MDDSAIPKSEKITDKIDLKPGDHLATRDELNSYSHHGIFIGPEEGVIHFSGERKTNAQVKIIPVDEFASGTKSLHRVIHSKSLDSDEVVRQAKQYLNEGNWEAYNLLENNCEHFATFCKTGFKHSQQVSDKLEEIASGGVSIGGSLATLATVSSLPSGSAQKK